LISFSSNWIGVAAATENSFTRIAELRQGLDFLFAAEGAASKLDLNQSRLDFVGTI
jgi:hypothetical protein